MKTEWFEQMRLVLISGGFASVERELDRLRVGLNEKQLGAVDSLREYLWTNTQRLPYRERLAAGRAIGSGLVEGACKNLIGRRLKQTGARRKRERVNRMATQCALLYGEQWNLYWNSAG